MNAYETARENYYRTAVQLAGAVTYPDRTGGEALPADYMAKLKAEFVAADAAWERELAREA